MCPKEGFFVQLTASNKTQSSTEKWQLIECKQQAYALMWGIIGSCYFMLLDIKASSEVMSTTANKLVICTLRFNNNKEICPYTAMCFAPSNKAFSFACRKFNKWILCNK